MSDNTEATLTRFDAFELVENFAIRAFGMSARSALDEESGCSLGRAGGWMSPRRAMLALIEQMESTLGVGFSEDDFMAEDEEDEE